MSARRAIGATVVALSLALTGCGSKGASAGASQSPAGASLVVWTDTTQQVAVQSAADRFTKATGVSVKVETHDDAKVASEFLAASDADRPDLVASDADYTGQFVAADAVAPLDLGQGTFQDVAVKAVTYAGKAYAVPTTLSSVALLRNTDLAPNSAATFDELLRAGEQLVKDGKADNVFAAGDPRTTTTDPYYLYPLQASFGAPLFTQNPDGTYAAKVAMDNDGGVKFANYLVAFGTNNDYDLSLTADAALQEFESGRLPYLITGAWNLAAVKKSGVKYAVEAVPSAGGQAATPFVTAQAYFVAATSSHLDSAEAFAVNYLGSEQTEGELATVTALPSARKSVTSSDADLAAFATVADAGVPAPNLPWAPLAWSDLATTEASLIQGKAGDAASAWNNMCSAINTAIK